MLNENPDRLSKTFTALSDATRRGILSLLADGEKTVTELVEAFDLSQPAISKHLKVLEEAGLIARRKQAQWRPARLRSDALREVFEWVLMYRECWEESSDRHSEDILIVQSDQQIRTSADQFLRDPQQTQKQSDWQMF